MKSLFTLFALFISLSAQALTIGAYNIRNYDYDTRARIHTNKRELISILRGLRADILSVEEINNTAEFAKFIPTYMPGYETALSNCGGAHGQRLGFIYNTRTIELLGFSEDLSVTQPGNYGTCDSGSRPIAFGLFQIKATKQKFYGLTLHLKSGSSPESKAKRFKQYNIVKQFILNLRHRTGVKDFFIAGDLNTTEFANRGDDYRSLNKVVSDLGMIILTKELDCSAYWWGGTDDGIESSSLLDHVIVTPGLLKNRANATVHGHCREVSCRSATPENLGLSYQSVSDHCPVTSIIQ